jgi:hypothetical protein
MSDQDTTHGSYTHLCELDGVVFYAHSPIGAVLGQFDPQPHADNEEEEEVNTVARVHV